MTFKVQKVCAVCGAAESPRRRLVTIPELMQLWPDIDAEPMTTTYCLSRRCVVKATFALALDKLKEKQGR